MNKFILILCLGLFSLTGCSRLDIAFRWADTYIASKVDDYFDISSKQSKELKHGIQKDLQELKAQVLPGWIDRLQGIQQEVQEGSINDTRVAFYFSSFLKDVEHINSYFSTTAVDFIASTNPTQLEHFNKAFQKKNREDLEKAQDLAKVKKEYREKYEEWFEMFLGSLTPEQMKMMEDNLNNSPFPAELKAKNKSFVMQSFLRHKDSPDEMKNFVKDYYNNPDKYDLPEYRSAFTKYQANLQKLVAQIISMMTQKQKESLKENINEKTAQLHSIIARG
ncbi:MAG: DUF6279 family lipoprotein [Bacillota bacterium]